MGLLDEIREASVPERPRCSVALAKESLDGDDLADLQAALDDRSLSGAGIAKVLTARLAAHGVKVGDNAVRRHRRGDCSCG